MLVIEDNGRGMDLQRLTGYFQVGVLAGHSTWTRGHVDKGTYTHGHGRVQSTGPAVGA